jgi:hypothetical protein
MDFKGKQIMFFHAMKEYALADRISVQEIRQFLQSAIKEQCINKTGRNI